MISSGKQALGLPHPTFLSDNAQHAQTARKLPVCVSLGSRTACAGKYPSQDEQRSASHHRLLRTSGCRHRGRRQLVLPLETLWSGGTHTQGVKNRVARLAGNFECKGQRAKTERGEPKTSWETSTLRISEKNRDPPSPFSLETVQSSLSDSPKEQENHCFLSRGLVH